MTFPKAVSDKFIFAPSLRRSPVAYVFDCLYEPAKSTKLSFEALNLSFPISSVYWDSIWMVKMLWDLDDSLFILVALTALLPKPISIYFCISYVLSTLHSVRSFTNIPFSGLSLSYIFALISFPRRSWISSL